MAFGFFASILSVALGTALGMVQIAIPLIRRKLVHTLEWLSLFFVIATGTVTNLTHDLRFVLFKPGVINVVLGLVMLKSSWIIRYLPAIARVVAPDVAVVAGYAWAAVMFVTATVNGLVAITYSVQTWAAVMLIFGIVSKAAVFIAVFARCQQKSVKLYWPRWVRILNSRCGRSPFRV